MQVWIKKNGKDRRQVSISKWSHNYCYKKNYNKKDKTVLFLLSVSAIVPMPYLLASFILILTYLTLQLTKVTQQTIRQFAWSIICNLQACSTSQSQNFVLLTCTDNTTQRVHMEEVYKWAETIKTCRNQKKLSWLNDNSLTGFHLVSKEYIFVTS